LDFQGLAQRTIENGAVIRVAHGFVDLGLDGVLLAWLPGGRVGIWGKFRIPRTLGGGNYAPMRTKKTLLFTLFPLFF
jgi:hypothetical protein